MDFFLYFESSIACFLGLLIILRRAIAESGSDRKSKYIISIIASTAFYIVCDAVVDVLFGDLLGLGIPNKLLITAAYSMYILSTLVMSMVWFSFAKHIMPKISTAVKGIIHLNAFLLILIVQFMLAFYREDYFIVLDEYGKASCGAWNEILYPFLYLPTLVIFIEAICKYKDKTLYAYRENFKQFFVYPILVVLVGMIQVWAPSSKAIIIGGTAACIYLYFASNESLIFTDELTGLDNRRQLMRNVDEKMKAGGDWFFVIADANSFKRINDVYGHSEGDRALVCIAEALNRVCFEYRASAYRYAGDEFVIIKDGSDVDEIESMCLRINEILKDRCDRDKNPYKISISYGYTEFDDNEHIAIPDIIKDADEKMYDMKNKFHNRGNDDD